MLIIKDQQLEAWHQYMVMLYIDSMVQHLKKRYPEQTSKIGDEHFRNLIFEGIEEAKLFNITDENDVKRYLEYLIEYGQDFGKSYETRWAGQFLNREGLSGTAKMDEIDNYDLFIISLGKNL